MELTRATVVSLYDEPMYQCVGCEPQVLQSRRIPRRFRVSTLGLPGFRMGQGGLALMRAIVYLFRAFAGWRVRADARGAVFSGGVLCIETDSMVGEIHV